MPEIDSHMRLIDHVLIQTLKLLLTTRHLRAGRSTAEELTGVKPV